MMTRTLTLMHPLAKRIIVPFSLGVFEDCTLILRRTEDGTWEGAVAYPEKISIRNEYPYIIHPETLESTNRAARFLFYPSSDMVGGVYEGEPISTLTVRVKVLDEQTVQITLVLDEQLYRVSDPQ